MPDPAVTRSTYRAWVARAAAAGRPAVPSLMLAARDARTPLAALAAMAALGSMRTAAADEGLRRIGRLPGEGPRRRVLDLAPSFVAGFGDRWGPDKLREMVGADLDAPFPGPRKAVSEACLGKLVWFCAVAQLGLRVAEARALTTEADAIDALLDEGRAAQALPHYPALLTAMPANPYLRLHYAMTLHEAGRPEDAEREATAVIEREPSADAFHIRARIRRHAGRLDGAAADIVAGLAKVDAVEGRHAPRGRRKRGLLLVERALLELNRGAHAAADATAALARREGQGDPFVAEWIALYDAVRAVVPTAG